MPQSHTISSKSIRMKHFRSPEDAINYAFHVLTRSLGDELKCVHAPESTVIKNKIHDINKASKRLLQAHRALIDFAESVADVLTETPILNISPARLQRLNKHRQTALALAGARTHQATAPQTTYYPTPLS